MTTGAAEPVFALGEVARLLGVSPSALKMAERQGRIPPAEREAGGDDRIYRAQDIVELKRYFHGWSVLVDAPDQSRK